MKFNEIRDFLSGKTKPEFGNLEQIKLIKKAEFRYDNLKNGIELDIYVEDDEPKEEYLHTADLVCVCGCNVKFEVYSDIIEEDADLFDEMNETCFNCKREYETYTEDWNVLKAKLSDE